MFAPGDNKISIFHLQNEDLSLKGWGPTLLELRPLAKAHSKTAELIRLHVNTW